jgi:hypothetical protein
MTVTADEIDEAAEIIVASLQVATCQGTG